MLTEALQRRRNEKPTGLTTLDDVANAEKAVAQAQEALRAYESSDENLRQTIDSNGVVGVVVERARAEKLETLRTKIDTAVRDLQATKRRWLGE
jgi:hypothetical protein